VTPAGRFAAAIDLLAALDAAPRRPADAIAQAFFRDRRYIGAGDRRAVAEQAWGVVRQRLRLRWWLDRQGAEPTPRLLAAAHALLVGGMRLSALGGAFTGSERHGPAPLSGAEQRTLRTLADRPLLAPEMPEDIRLNLPAWAVDGLRRRFGADLPAEAAELEAEAALDLRANLLKGTRAEAIAALAAEAIEAAPTPLSPWGLRIPSRRPVTGTAAYREGRVEVQDEGSQIVAALADPRPGLRVCDLCAGAGGKTLAMAATMDNRGRITACDVNAPRLEGATRRFRRAGVHNAECHLLTPGDKWAKRRAGQFDRVLVDAPCTGTGTWRRNPDARTRTGPDDLAALLTKQGEILSMSAELVRPGGLLVYATCSLLPEEDEGQVTAFLTSHPEFAAVPMTEAWSRAGLGAAPPMPAAFGPYLLLSPARHGTDGFFAAVLRRAGVG
jgi:16S rRNA (cytosine967-C5)-methyltransferase